MALKLWQGGASGNETDWNTAANWSPSGVPAAGDDIVVPADAAYAIAGTTVANTVNTFTTKPAASVAVGSPDTPLIIDMTAETDRTIRLAGSGQTVLEPTACAALYVDDAGSAAAAGEFDVHIAGGDITDAYILPASGAAAIGLAALPDESLALDNLYVDAGEVSAGTLTGLGLAELAGGTVSLASAPSTVLRNTGAGAELTYTGPNVATVELWSGRTIWANAADITTALKLSGELDLSGIMQAVTIAAATVYGGAVLSDPYRVATWTAGIDLAGTTLAAVALDFGTDANITPA